MQVIGRLFNCLVLLALLSGLPGWYTDSPASAAVIREPASPTVSDVVISQVYGGGGNSGAYYKNDFIELYNRGAATVSLAGWSVQYGSASSTGVWSVTALSGSIAPGKYYLVQEAAGTGGSANLPTPDAIGTIAMSSTAGKVALVNTTTALNGACPTAGGTMVDYVGYGTTNCAETSPTPALSNTTAALRKDDGATDTDHNYNDFTVGAPNPRNSSYLADVRIDKSGSAMFIPGKPLVYQVTVQNLLPSQATGVVVTDTLPISTTYVSDTSGVVPFNPAPGVYVWNIGNVNAKSSRSFDVVIDTDGGMAHNTIITNTVVMTSTAIGDEAVNNSDKVLSTATAVVPIATARAGSNGQVFAVEGYVTVAPGSYSANEWELQDASGGIGVFYSPTPALALGDHVLLIATRSTFNGQEQLGAPVYYFHKLGSGPEVAPRTDFSTGDVAGGSSEGWLIQVRGTVSGLTTCTGTHSFYVDDGTGPAYIYVDSDTGIDSCAKGITNGSTVLVTGFSTEYNGLYEIKPRRPADIQTPAPRISKSAPLMVAPGELFTYTIHVENGLGYDLSNVIVSDTLPANADLAGISDGGVLVGDQVQWEIPNLPDQTILQLQFAVTAPATNDSFILNDDYAIRAANFLTPTFGAQVLTIVNDRISIHHIQGPGSRSPFADQTLNDIFGIVTWLQNDGFYMQEPVSDVYPETSEGIFVYTGSAPAVKIGEGVTVTTGLVYEYFNMTELKNVTIITATTPLTIAPTAVDLPGDLEYSEGMLVTFPETLTVAQNYFLGRYGQLTLSAEGRLYNPTSDNDNSTLEQNLRRMIVLDDNTSAENPLPVPYIGAENTQRAGDTVVGLTGVVDYGLINSSGGRFYRLQPTVTPVFTRANDRNSAPELLAGNLRIASFNVLNYFNGNGDGSGFPTSRGASSADEFDRQRTKIIIALLTIDADVIGLMEIENDNVFSATQTLAVQDLVNGLNDIAGAGVYDYIREPAPGVDAIKVAMIYKPGKVTPAGAAQNYQVDIGGYASVFDRPPLGQTFFTNANGDKFSVIVNHFKSKGSCPASGLDADQGDGQGCWNAKRTAQAGALLNFISQLQASSADSDVVVLGDLNAYAEEDPVNTLLAGGLVNLIFDKLPAEQRYTYVFDGMLGYLDHMLATPTMAVKSAGVAIWHINADEPAILDYNTEYNPPSFYSPTPYRSSDHDPVIGSFFSFAYYFPWIYKNYPAP